MVRLKVDLVKILRLSCRLDALVELSYPVHRIFMATWIPSINRRRDYISAELHVGRLEFPLVHHVSLRCRSKVVALPLDAKLEMPASKASASAQTPPNFSLHHGLVELRNRSLLLVIVGGYPEHRRWLIAHSFVKEARLVFRPGLVTLVTDCPLATCILQELPGTQDRALPLRGRLGPIV